MKGATDPTRRRQRGFTLIELLVSIVVIGVLASIALPVYTKNLERTIIADAITCFSVLRNSQERYMARNDTYASTTAALDVTCPPSTHFAPPSFLPGVGATYVAVLTRTPAAPAPYGQYTVTYSAPSGTYACDVLRCLTDLLP